MQKRRSKNAVWPAWEWRRPSDSELICSQHWKLTNNRQFGSSCRRYLLLFGQSRRRSGSREWSTLRPSEWRQFQQLFIMQINFTLFIAVSDGIPCINFGPSHLSERLGKVCLGVAHSSLPSSLSSSSLSLSLLLSESTPALSTGIIAALKSFRVQIFN